MELIQKSCGASLNQVTPHTLPYHCNIGLKKNRFLMDIKGVFYYLAGVKIITA